MKNYEIEQYKIKDISEKLLNILCHQKYIIFFLCMYKWFKSAKKNTKNAKLKLSTKKDTFGEIEKVQKQKQVLVANWAQFFDKCDPEKQKHRQGLTPNTEYQRYRVFVQNDQSKEKLKAAENHQKDFQNSKNS